MILKLTLSPSLTDIDTDFGELYSVDVNEGESVVIVDPTSSSIVMMDDGKEVVIEEVGGSCCCRCNCGICSCSSG